MSTEDKYKAGMQVRYDMFGKEMTDQRVEAASDFMRPFEDVVTENCFGDTWSRPGLDRKTRSMITLAALTALTKPNQLKAHIQGAIANGVSVEEVREIIMHTSVYSGIPTGVEGMVAAQDILETMGLL